MKRTLRFGLPVAVLAALIVGGVLLATRPWSGDTLVQEAAAGTITYRLCDTIVEAPPKPKPPIKPEKDLVSVVPIVEQTAAGDLIPKFEVRLRIPSVGDPSLVLIDAVTGTVLQELYSSPAHQALLRPVLNTVRTEPLDPATAPWPYTDAAQIPPSRGRAGPFELRSPDPGSGIVAVHHLENTPVGEPLLQAVIARNCRSTMAIIWQLYPDGREEVTVERDVHPDDAAAFQTFYDEVVIKGLDL